MATRKLTPAEERAYSKLARAAKRLRDAQRRAERARKRNTQFKLQKQAGGGQ